MTHNASLACATPDAEGAVRRSLRVRVHQHRAERSKAKRIGLLLEADGDPPQAAHGALAKRGWVRDRNLFWVKRVAKSEAELRIMARDLVATNVDLIFTFSTPATLAAKAATTTIPILFTVGADPVENGIVASLARPGGNATGVAHGLYDEKLLQYLRCRSCPA